MEDRTEIRYHRKEWRIAQAARLETKGLRAQDLDAPTGLEDVCWNPAGSRLVGVNRDTLTLWDSNCNVAMQMPRENRRDDLPFDPEVRFSPDGKKIAATMWDLPSALILLVEVCTISGDTEHFVEAGSV